MAEVSVWTTEFRAGTLPSICVKSGQPADSKLKFRFSTITRPRYNVPVRITVGLLTAGNLVIDPGARQYRAAGWLPLTRRWRTIFIVFRVVAICAAAIGILAVIAAAFLAWPPAIFVFGFGLGAYLVSHILYAGLRPKGKIYVTSSGEEWVHLVDVHPNFVAAVEAMEAAAANSQAAPSE